MKKAIIILLIMIILATLPACTNSIKINGIRFSNFEELFINGLPEEVEDDTICHDMYINHSKSILGDPNYVISFALKFNDSSAFYSHIQKINTTSAIELQFDGTTYYLFQGTKEGLQEYTNTRILDGYFFAYEIISVNAETMEIDYLYAYVWDYWKDEFLISKLVSVFCDFETSSAT